MGILNCTAFTRVGLDLSLYFSTTLPSHCILRYTAGIFHSVHGAFEQTFPSAATTRLRAVRTLPSPPSGQADLPQVPPAPILAHWAHHWPAHTYLLAGKHTPRAPLHYSNLQSLTSDQAHGQEEGRKTQRHCNPPFVTLYSHL